MKVIFNADDFGFSKGVNLGIIETYRCGPVRSATLMAGMPGFEHAILLARENPGLKIGIHLTLSAVKSVGGVYKTLTDGERRFLPLAEVERRAHAGEIELTEVEGEYEAQIQKILAAGILPDHFDSHHHTHMLPGIVTVFLKLAKKYGVKARMLGKNPLSGAFAEVKSTALFDETFYGETASPEHLRHILSKGGIDSLEIMCHPAFVDHTLYSMSSYNIKRAYELSVLTSPEIMDFISRRGIALCSFSDL